MIRTLLYRTHALTLALEVPHPRGLIAARAIDRTLLPPPPPVP